MTQHIIGVMGPGTASSLSNQRNAYELGRLIAQQNWVLLTGGRAAGVMDAACRGAKQAGGLTVGILPGSDRAGMSSAVDIPIVTGLGNARNAVNILSSDVVVACGMGSGTASEVALALKANKRVILLDQTAPVQAFFTELGRELGERNILIAATPNETIEIIKSLLKTAQ
ncbi:TIGR00725 family protein [Oculatella sp. LEGE 06141]|uniref:TIGR00725 family protein n=1 Tax=Oculatella sp. LEGE 06141 TaxID=1828648 RepID=UPI001882E888|nr:TIGR00725 family protein [Oculatella sp. LEGE 06141]MBE9177890.1 TIGR00725 family protein [Oculatella sp. LEGE 06141]